MFEDDLAVIDAHAGVATRELEGKRLLLTGGAGFLGFSFLHYFDWLNRTRFAHPLEVVCLDPLLRGSPAWLDKLASAPWLKLAKASVIDAKLEDWGPFDYVIHAASIASPKFYRLHPIETMDANVAGLRNILEYARRHKISSVLSFSSSEIYGDPDPANIPTREDYRGLVSCTGPRACYDESKRYGETLCVNFTQQYGVPVKTVRPFNNYGPGLALEDARVIPDFSSDILAGRDVVLLSDGSPTRTFCYVADAVGGYLLALMSSRQGEAFNIGTDAPEISMADLASALMAAANETAPGSYQGKLVKKTSEEKAYLVDNPNRRCPDITKARMELGYEPRVPLAEGLRRTLRWYRGELAGRAQR